MRDAIAGHGLTLWDLAAELVGAYPSLASSVTTLSVLPVRPGTSVA